MRKKHIIFPFTLLLLIVFGNNLTAQVLQIYTATSQQPIEKAFKIADPEDIEKLYFVVAPPDMYSAEKIYRYNHSRNVMEIPHNGFVSAWCGGSPISCSAFDNLQISAKDTNVMLRAFQDAWWEPMGHIDIYENGTLRRLFQQGMGYYYLGMAIDPVNDQNLYVVWKYGSFDSTNTFYRSTDRGHTWTGNSSINIGQTMHGSSLKVNPFNNSILLYPMNNYVLKSTNFGESFVVLSNNTGNVSEIVFDKVDRIIYFVTNQGLFAADEYAENFHQISNKIFNTIIVDRDDNNILFAGDYNGLWRSANQGITWTLYSNLFEPTRNVNCIVHNASMGDTLLVSTARGIYKVFGDSVLTGTSSNEINVAGDFNLYQNYPNPFNPVTGIKYEIPQSGKVLLTIYDLSGKEISRLVNEFQSSGSYEVTFDANSRSIEMASGVYFCNLTVTSGDNSSSVFYSKTMRMILLK